MGSKKIACKDCTGLFWKQLFSSFGSYPAGSEARCKKSENKKIKEEEFNPISGEIDKFEFYPGGTKHPFGEKGDQFKLCSEVNFGDCLKFEAKNDFP